MLTKNCNICKNIFEYTDNKNYHRVRDHCHCTGIYRGSEHSICYLRYKVPTEIPVVFNSGSDYDYYFIINEMVREFKVQFECPQQNIEESTFVRCQ